MFKSLNHIFYDALLQLIVNEIRFIKFSITMLRKNAHRAIEKLQLLSHWITYIFVYQVINLLWKCIDKKQDLRIKFNYIKEAYEILKEIITNLNSVKWLLLSISNSDELKIMKFDIGICFSFLNFSLIEINRDSFKILFSIAAKRWESVKICQRHLLFVIF